MKQIAVAAAVLLAVNTVWGAEQMVSGQSIRETAVEAMPVNGEAPDPGRPLRQVMPLEEDAVERLPVGVFSGMALAPVIPGLEHPLTQRYISHYTSPGGLSWLKQAMARGEPYLAFIRREIEERELPPELLYLPVIESAFLSTAKSASGAVGLWQFMKNSITPFDMKVTEWMDERMDFWKSTQGALSKLQDNFKQLQDWPLALAAYNAGLGAVNRTISRTGIKDYWELSDKKHFKSETVHFVPKLLAVAAIVSDPRRYGLDALWPEDPQWTRVPVGRPADLEILAEAAGIDGEVLKAANRELYYGVTPPGSGYSLKVRAADEAAVREVLDQTEIPLILYHYHTIQSGNTLSELAQHYGVSVAQITEANPGIRARFLRIGQRIRIPAVRDVRPYMQAGASKRTDAADFTGTHLVKQGETLWSIALAYDVDPEALAAANGISMEATLRVGKTLKTPVK
ncbi:MAG: LysM peptidoglycan-binding domain-containing protein [Treponema sp.]|nr:LysM peptidoglycan-binding domain-containing protein [Treponema sp.]